MDHAYIDKLAAAKANVTIIEEEYKKKIAAAKKTVTDLQERCDHKHPDGTSALNNGFFAVSCPICHLFDF